MAPLENYLYDSLQTLRGVSASTWPVRQSSFVILIAAAVVVLELPFVVAFPLVVAAVTFAVAESVFAVVTKLSPVEPVFAVDAQSVAVSVGVERLAAVFAAAQVAAASVVVPVDVAAPDVVVFAVEPIAVVVQAVVAAAVVVVQAVVVVAAGASGLRDHGRHGPHFEPRVPGDPWPPPLAWPRDQSLRSETVSRTRSLSRALASLRSIK